ncbi:hypothetical protein C8Q78DRAFT_191110 [Trametes maxima]|nr:hypothetical protein C8Q78DRAFT_191110 [Trametes maxima]
MPYNCRISCRGGSLSYAARKHRRYRISLPDCARFYLGDGGASRFSSGDTTIHAAAVSPAESHQRLPRCDWPGARGSLADAPATTSPTCQRASQGCGLAAPRAFSGGAYQSTI